MYYTLHCAYFQLFRASETPYRSSQSSLNCSVERGTAKWHRYLWETVTCCEHWILSLYRILILYLAYTCNSVIKSRKRIKGFVSIFLGGKPSGDFRVRILMIKTMYKRQVQLSPVGHWWVLGVYSWCQLTLKKKISCFRVGTCLDSLWFLSGRKLGSMQIKSFWNPFSKIKSRT